VRTVASRLALAVVSFPFWVSAVSVVSASAASAASVSNTESHIKLLVYNCELQLSR